MWIAFPNSPTASSALDGPSNDRTEPTVTTPSVNLAASDVRSTQFRRHTSPRFAGLYDAGSPA